MPKTFSLIRQRIPVISARQMYEDKYPRDSTKWKKYTFRDLVTKPFCSLQTSKDKRVDEELGIFNEFKFDRRLDGVRTNLVIVGDSQNEMRAGCNLHEYLESEYNASRCDHKPEADQAVTRNIVSRSSKVMSDPASSPAMHGSCLSSNSHTLCAVQASVSARSSDEASFCSNDDNSECMQDRRSFLKEIKFSSEPEPRDLLKQLKLLLRHWDSFFCSEFNISIKLENTRGAKK